MDMENHHLQPLIYPPSPSSSPSSSSTTPQDGNDLRRLKLISSNSSIILRLSFVVFVSIVSIWANHEASKGFAITLVNEAGDTLPGKRFQLFFASNDEATRMVIKASKIIENFLYPDDDSLAKKSVRHVILKLADRELTDKVIVNSNMDHEFVLNISPSIMEGTNIRHAMFLAVQQGVARVWLWDGQGNAPKVLINGIVEYITNYLADSGTISNLGTAQPPPESAATTACSKLEDSRAVAEFLNFCERRRPGFVRRLNRAMKDAWHDGNLDAALGLPVQNLRTTYKLLRFDFSSV